ncbi:hypothetical protein RchiOBHm_Chr4g0401621 [Rosa chinensis]|uniref:Uncharacterized protein n=1 Tax=Rosa chinensis TaxID=74649 RepID=A0A2P6QT49_ROSCH|nr:hypothetical protein RchiOBHm_Chr4g0401621 [Rosa chinensis]
MSSKGNHHSNSIKPSNRSKNFKIINTWSLLVAFGYQPRFEAIHISIRLVLGLIHPFDPNGCLSFWK